jgi:hypothetical protein
MSGILTTVVGTGEGGALRIGWRGIGLGTIADLAGFAALPRLAMVAPKREMGIPEIAAGHPAFCPNRVQSSRPMKTMVVVFALALITIAFEAYSDASLTSADVSHTTAPDPATIAIAHGVQRR